MLTDFLVGWVGVVFASSAVKSNSLSSFDVGEKVANRIF